MGAWRRPCERCSRSPLHAMGSRSNSRSSEGAGMAEGPRASTQRLVVALVRGVHGLRGAVRIEVLTDRPEQRYAQGSTLFVEGSDRTLTISSAEAVADGPGWRLRFREVTSREGADALRDAYLEA